MPSKRIAHLIFILIALGALSGCLAPLPRDPGEPPFEFRTDGCTLAPDLDLTACCEAHDRAYWRGGSCEQRRRADEALHRCIVDRGHPILAPFYFGAVRVAGTPLLPTYWRWGFGWPYGMGYSEPCD